MSKAPKDRGAKDDFEALQMVLNGNQALKQRVMHRLRALKSMAADRSKGFTIDQDKANAQAKEDRRKNRK